MSHEKNNFNTSNNSTRILTPNDATIIETTKYLLTAEHPEKVLTSLNLLLDGFLQSEIANEQDLRTNAFYHFGLLKDFLQTSINSTPKTVK